MKSNKITIKIKRKNIDESNGLDEIISNKTTEINNCFNDIKQKIGELLEISKNPRLNKKQKISVNGLLSDALQLFETKDKPVESILSKGGINKWVDDLDRYLQEKISLLFEMLINWISPFRVGSRGMQGKIFVHVEDRRMGQMIESLKNNKNWECKRVVYNLRSFPFTQNVESIKWSTMDENVVEDLLGKFRVCDGQSILTQHYICLAEDKSVFHSIEYDKINTNYMVECCDQVGWDYWRQNIVLQSTKVVFGNYTKCGSITSNEFNDSRIVEYAKDEKLGEEIKTKKKRGASLGRFSIQYLKGVYPLTETGWLRINCKYRLSSNGILAGN